MSIWPSILVSGAPRQWCTPPKSELSVGIPGKVEGVRVLEVLFFAVGRTENRKDKRA